MSLENRCEELPGRQEHLAYETYLPLETSSITGSMFGHFPVKISFSICNSRNETENLIDSKILFNFSIEILSEATKQQQQEPKQNRRQKTNHHKMANNI